MESQRNERLETARVVLQLAQPHQVIDAILGSTLDGPPHPVQRGLIRAARAATEAGVPVLSLDVPSGLDADAGLPAEEALPEDAVGMSSGSLPMSCLRKKV